MRIGSQKRAQKLRYFKNFQNETEEARVGKFSKNKGHKEGSIFDLLKRQRKEMYYAILQKRSKAHLQSSAKLVADMMEIYSNTEPELPENVVPFVVRNIQHIPKGK